MENILALKRRIKAVKEIKHITGAMKMVATTKLHKAQERVESSRPFARKISEVLIDLSQVAGSFHPLMESRAVRRTCLVLFTSDQGLSGAYNANLIRHARSFLSQLPSGREVTFLTVGRKGRDYFRRKNYRIGWDFSGRNQLPTFALSAKIASIISEQYRARECDEVYLLYTRFYSPHHLEPRTFRLLPIRPVTEEQKKPAMQGSWSFEPSLEAILEHLIQRYIETEIYRALLEADASEKGARLAAMSTASDNADELIAELIHRFNHYRQGIITNQLTELMGGVEALAKK
ncbi:MAG TPA: ATP synthase F1 subunit gamma [Firmicutes bacterium]|nr:ATP synthase F1 subunit gamma [Bacillota bacterium]